MEITFQREISTPDLHRELTPLLREHYVEVAHFKQIPLDPDFGRYDELEKAGILRVFTARRPCHIARQAGHIGPLIGYAIFIVNRNLHYRRSLQALQDVLFFTSDSRAGLAGFRFIKWCDKQLKAEGVEAVYHHVKLARDFGPVLERLGYEKVESVYARRI